MDRKAFTKALATRLYPILRAEGFRGSGSTLRRTKGLVIHVFNVQGSSDATTCYLNLGAHLLFLPMPGGGQPDAEVLKEYQCVFRDRIDPPTGSPFGWFYGNTIEELNEQIEYICDHWPIYGHAFFDQYSEYPQSFLALLNKVDATAVHPMELLTLARIAKHMSDHARSVAFAQEALNRCPERATGLRAELEQISKMTTVD